MHATRQQLKKHRQRTSLVLIYCFLYILSSPGRAAGFDETMSEYEGRYAGSYLEGPWYWTTKRSFSLSLSRVTEGRHGKIFLNHSTLGDCEGSYVVNLNRGPQRDQELIIYSANLHCPQVRKPHFVFQISLPKTTSVEGKQDFSSEFYIRPAKDNGMRIRGDATLIHLTSF